jgi:hypothetical protein
VNSRRFTSLSLAAFLVFAPFAAGVQPANALDGIPAGCVPKTDDYKFAHCQIDKSGKFSMAVIGDSHARSWIGPMRKLARKYSWKLTVVSKSACPILDPDSIPKHIPSPSCAQWNRKLLDFLSGSGKFDLIVTASSSLVTHGYKSYSDSFASVAPKITATGATLLVIRDNPKPKSGFQNCLRLHGSTAALDCAQIRWKALNPRDKMPQAVSGSAGVKVADFTDAYCGPQVCSPIIDGILVYRDHSHITGAFANHLTPKLDSVIPGRFKN